MLSVLSTPWAKPKACHSATSRAVRATVSRKKAAYLAAGSSVASSRVEARDRMVRERLDVSVLAARMEELERAEAHERRGEPREDGGRLGPLAEDGEGRSPRSRARASSGCRDACIASLQRYSRIVERSTARPSREARKRRHPRALELPFPALARGVFHLAERDRAPVAELRDEVAELMPRIDRRDSAAARRRSRSPRRAA